MSLVINDLPQPLTLASNLPVEIRKKRARCARFKTAFLEWLLVDHHLTKVEFLFWNFMAYHEHCYSRVPIRRGVRNKRSGTQDEKCIGRNISHMCLGLYSRCRFILTNLYLKVLHFDILIQLKGTAHFLENVLGLIKGVCRINVPCLLIGTRE